MSDRFQDPNWGPYGNPNHDTSTPRQLNELRSNTWYKNGADRPLFHDGVDTKVSVWTIFWVIMVIIILSGFSETARGLVFYGVNIAEHWYSAVDSLLDTLGAPKLP